MRSCQHTQFSVECFSPKISKVPRGFILYCRMAVQVTSKFWQIFQVYSFGYHYPVNNPNSIQIMILLSIVFVIDAITKLQLIPIQI